MQKSHLFNHLLVFRTFPWKHTTPYSVVFQFKLMWVQARYHKQLKAERYTNNKKRESYDFLLLYTTKDRIATDLILATKGYVIRAKTRIKNGFCRRTALALKNTCLFSVAERRITFLDERDIAPKQLSSKWQLF